MNNPKNHTEKHDDATVAGPVTVSITQHVKPGKEREFEQWLQAVGKVAAGFAGHQGLTVLPPAQQGKRAYTYIFRFDTNAHLQVWEQSTEKALWVDKLSGITETPATKQFVTGLEYWFHLPGGAATTPPPHYKMMAVTVLAIYPLSLMVPLAMGPITQSLPPLMQSFSRACVLVGLMTYLVMPLMIKLIARWLFKGRM